MPDAPPPPDSCDREAFASITRTLEALQCGVSVVDRTGTMVFINDRLAEMMNRPAGEVVGKKVSDLYTDNEVRDRIGRMLDRFDEPVESEFYVERPDGTHMPVISAARPLRDDEAGIDLRVVTIVDVTQLKEMADEVHRLNDTIIGQALDLKHHSEKLEEKVAERTAELREANMSTIYMLAVASEARDEDTGSHVRRIECFARAVAEAVGIDAAEAERIGYSAILHDVGKIHVPDSILKKPGKLTDEERAEMQRHTLIGETILKGSSFFETARQIARSHHENFDGSGYPDGIAGDAIPLPARIVHVVDVYDALISPRVYKDPWPTERAIATIQQDAGVMFDPGVVDAFVRLCDAGDVDRLTNGL